MDIDFVAKLDLSPGEHDPGSWIITHGLGTPAGNTYTEVRFGSLDGLGMSQAHRAAVCTEAVRQVADQLYGTRWAFSYPPEEYESTVIRFRTRRRECVVVNDIRVYS